MSSHADSVNRIVLSYPDGKAANAPRRFKVSPRWPVLVSALATVVVAGGGLVSFVGMTMAPCLGATRASRLRWQQVEADAAESETPVEQKAPAVRVEIRDSDEGRILQALHVNVRAKTL